MSHHALGSFTAFLRLRAKASQNTRILASSRVTLLLHYRQYVKCGAYIYIATSCSCSILTLCTL